ncbi:hypothetical protein Q3G72_004967 [Acer saccharum]|nr:hypothetical protein Q3G72_004967 [Acer saccharum]
MSLRDSKRKFTKESTAKNVAKIDEGTSTFSAPHLRLSKDHAGIKTDANDSSDQVVSQIDKASIGSGRPFEVSPGADLATIIGGATVGQADATVLSQTSIIPLKVIPRVVSLISQTSVG